MEIAFERVQHRLEEMRETPGREESLMEIWYKVLEDVSKEGASKAIAALLLEESKPRSAEDFPVRLRALAKGEELRSRRPDESPREPYGGPWPEEFYERFAAMVEFSKTKKLDLVMETRVWALSRSLNNGRQEWILEYLSEIEKDLGMNEPLAIAAEDQETPF